MERNSTITDNELKEYINRDDVWLKLGLIKVENLKEANIGKRGHKFSLTASVLQEVCGELPDTVLTWKWGGPPKFLQSGKHYIIAVFNNEKTSKSKHHQLLGIAEFEQGKEAEAIAHYKQVIKNLKRK